MARVSLKSPIVSQYISYDGYSTSMPRRYGSTNTTSSYLQNNLDTTGTGKYGSGSGSGSLYGTSRYYGSPSLSPSYNPATSSINTSRVTSLRNRPSSPGGRPLPRGPGPQNASGQKTSFRTTIYTTSPSDTLSHRSKPMRVDHYATTSLGRRGVRSPSAGSLGTDSESSYKRTSLRKRADLVPELTSTLKNMNVSDSARGGLPRSKQHGSNMDLSGSRLSTPDKVEKELITSILNRDSSKNSSYTPRNSISKRGSRSISNGLPELTQGKSAKDNSYSRSPDQTQQSSYSEDSAATKRAIYAGSRHDSQSSIKGGSSLDQNSNPLGSLSVSSDNRGLVGLRNLGNTCFMNSVIQCLSNTRLLQEYCLDGSYEDEINKSSGMKGSLVKSYGKMMNSLWTKMPDAVISPTDFKSQISKFAPRFIGYNQQDAQEFLVYLLEGLHEDLNRIHTKKKRFIDDSTAVETISASEKATKMWKHYITCDNSKIVDIFVGQLKSTLTCTICDYKSNTFDPFWQLSLPLKGRSVSSVTLRDCFDLFTNQETLDGDERPTCAQCQKRQKCTKSFVIQKFPQVLVIHLKRFNQGAYIRSKLSTSVDYPLEGLDLSSYAAESHAGPVIYNLYAIINHLGSTVGGHYTADAKHPRTGQWHHFNDIRVSNTSRQRVKSEEAYVLFYELADKTSRL